MEAAKEKINKHINGANEDYTCKDKNRKRKKEQGKEGGERKRERERETL